MVLLVLGLVEIKQINNPTLFLFMSYIYILHAFFQTCIVILVDNKSGLLLLYHMLLPYPNLFLST